MKKRLVICFLTFASYYSLIAIKKFDVTVVGYILFADGLGRLSIGFIDCLKKDLKINFIPTRKSNFRHVPKDVCSIVKSSSAGYSKVSILFDALWYPPSCAARYVPENSSIKYAYSMLESTEIPKEWVTILNKKFDAVLVPDEWLVSVYFTSGVKIPIFVFPHGLYLEDFLKQEQKKNRNETFTFGTSLAFDIRKNHELLLEAFCKEFQNERNVKLIIHGRNGGDKKIVKNLKKIIEKYHISNVQIIWQTFTQKEYIAFFKRLDCFVSISQGEGFAVPPREALAMGIPCILSNNTAHKTICNTGFVESIKSEKMIPAFYPIFNNTYGFKFNCKLMDVQKAMRRVYNNYETYLEKAKQSRKWVKQYDYKNKDLQNKYKTLIKPKVVLYSDKNVIGEDGIIETNSIALLKKLKSLQFH